MILALSLTATTVARASAPTAAWTTTVTMNVQTGSVAIDHAGNVYVTGTRQGLESVAVLRKFGPDGRPLWTRTWSQPDAHAGGELVAVAATGSVYFAGSIGSNHFEGGAWFLRKYKPDGTLVWARDEPGWQHGGTADSPSGLATTAAGAVLSGSFQGCCGDFRIRDGWVLSFGADGRRKWRNGFEPGSGLNAFSDVADSVAVGANGGIFVGGWTALGAESEEVTADHELLLQRLDRGGSVVWSRSFPETADDDQEFDADLAVHGDALMVEAFVDGSDIRGSGRPGHTWLGRFTLGGDLRWSRSWGRSSRRAAQPSALAVAGRGRTFVIGMRRDPSDHGLDVFLRAYTVSGRLVWGATRQAGQRFLVGADVAWRSDVMIATGEALAHRYGRGTRGYVWSFAA